MKLFKDSKNNVYAYEEDGSQDYLIGNKIALTQEEIEARNKYFSDLNEQGLKAEQAAATAKASALAKLTALGLTQDEVKALIG